jgi:hypothetical protein
MSDGSCLLCDAATEMCLLSALVIVMHALSGVLHTAVAVSICRKSRSRCRCIVLRLQQVCRRTCS